MAEPKKWFLYGCLGCLGVVVLVILVAVIISGMAWMQVGNEQVKDHVSTQTLPVTTTAEPASPEGLQPQTHVGRVRLDLNRAAFEIHPLAAGEQLRVEATYDENSYELTESLVSEEGGGWTYDVHFISSGSNLMGAIRQLFGGTQPKVYFYLPTNIPLVLELSLTEGGGEVDLSGMWLTELDVEFDKGGLEIIVEEPLRQPAERVSIRGSMGGLEASRFGNASPRRLDVDISMGGFDLDLRGQWLNDADIDVRANMGGGVLRLPRDVLVEGLDTGSFRQPEEVEIAPPTLRFTTSVRNGELEVLD